MGIDFDILISGEYRIMIEPIAYVTLQGVRVAMTATEAAYMMRLQAGWYIPGYVQLPFKICPLQCFSKNLI